METIKLQKQFKSWLLLVMLLVTGVGTTWGETVSWTHNGTNSDRPESIGDFTVEWAKGSGSTAPTSYAESVRLYAAKAGTGNTITISNEKGYYITKVELTGTVNQGTLSFTWNGTTSTTGNYYAEYAESNNVTSVTATLKNTSTSKTGQFRLTGIKVTYVIPGGGSTPTAPYTVTFDAGSNGTCSTSSLTEASVGAGVTLPEVTANEGWSFQGWSTSATPTSADAGVAGATYKPSADITLNAYYKVIPVAPTFGTAAGEVEKGTEITFSSTTDGCTFHYTTDGSDPTASTGTQASSYVVNEATNLKVVAVKDGIASPVSSASYTVATHTATFYVNGSKSGEPVSYGKGDNITFPADPADIEGKKFVGWTKTENYSNATDAPSDLCKEATMGEVDVIYYAVFATVEEGETVETKTQTLQYDTWTYSGSTTDKSTYRLFHSGSYIESASFDRSKLSKVIVYGGTFGGASYKNLTIGDGTNTWKSVTVSGSSETGTNTYTDGTALSGTGFIRITSNSGSASSNGVRISKVEIYTMEGGYTYSDYCTSLVTKYDVTFNLQGHGEAIESQSIAEGEKVTEPTAPEATGYTFGGWYKESGCTNAWNFSTDVMGTSAVTLYAKWTAINYTITYNNVEGATHINPATYTIETETINLTDASKDGYIFQGWFDNESYEGDAVTTIAQGSTGNKTFWAKWVEVPATPSTVTFNVGEHGTCETSSATEETVGAGVVLPAVTANEGWVFKGWSTENPATAETLVSAGDDGKYHILANTDLYAYYKVKPATPTFSSEAGTIEKGTEVTISCTTEGAAIYYTTNGDEPTAESTAYSEAIAVNAEQTIKAIAILDGEQSNVASAAYTIAQHTAQFSINGVITAGNNCTVAKGEAIVFPADPAAPEEHVFIGWKKGGEEVTTPQDEAIATVDKAAEVMGTDDVTYYAVWAVGSGSGEASYTKLATNSFDADAEYVLAAEETSDESTLHYFSSYTGTTANESWGVTSTDDADAIIFKLSGTADALVAKDASNNYIQALATGKFRMLSSSTTLKLNNNGQIYNPTQGSTGYNLRYNHNNGSGGFRWYNGSTGTSAYFYKKESSGNYSDYSTKVSLDPKPTIVLSATELAEYAGNTNTTITASVSEGAYTGALAVESSAEAVATASISEGTITINALTAGTATITVTAPAVTGWRKATATIAVTISEKLAHGLSFSADVLNLTVGDTEFTEPTLDNPNSLPVVYSLVYAKSENEDKVATIDPATGKLTLADPSLSTETQGAVTVKATTVGDNSHVAGEVTYNLVVARKVTSTSWSNEGAAVTIDKDEIATLPTATNSGERNLFYESSNEDVAKFVDGVLTFVAYGTTTITAKTNATAEYAATSATYELTFAPRYTVTFKVFGQDDVVLREETTGAGVTAPAVEPIDGKVFRGWTENEIDGTTDDVPTFVTTETLNEDKILYAVFATENVGIGQSGTITLKNTTISDLGTTEWAYSDTGKELTEDDYTWSFDGTYHGKNVAYLQLGQKSGLIHTPTCPGNITSIVVNCKGSTGRNLQVYSGDTKVGDAVSTPTSDADVTLIISGSYTQLNIANHDGNGGYSNSNNAININSITVNYGPSTTYSDYCTAVKATPNLSFSEPNYEATVGEEFTAPTLTKPEDVTVTYSSSDENVAEVNVTTGEVTLKAPGTTTITASFDGTESDKYYSNSASYELVVNGTVSLIAHAGTTYYATFSNAANVQFVDDTEVYAVTVDGDRLVMNEIEGKQVPTANGVLLKTTSNKAVYKVISEANAIEENNMHPASEEMSSIANCEFFKLAYGDPTAQTKLGFWYGAEGGAAFTCKAGTAYLAIPAGTTLAKGFVFDDMGTATGIFDLETSTDYDRAVNIAGQRVNASVKGIVIKNGRKYINK